MGAGGKPSTWFPPGRLSELQRVFIRIRKNFKNHIKTSKNIKKSVPKHFWKKILKIENFQFFIIFCRVSHFYNYFHKSSFDWNPKLSITQNETSRYLLNESETFEQTRNENLNSFFKWNFEISKKWQKMMKSCTKYWWFQPV